MRLGLCCIFKEEPVRFRTTTARALSSMTRPRQLEKLSSLFRKNLESLVVALETVRRPGIGAFRVTSPLHPRFTHPEVGYLLEDLPEGGDILRLFGKATRLAKRCGIRPGFHPDQYVVLSSPRPEVVENSLGDLEYHGMLASPHGAETITIPGEESTATGKRPWNAGGDRRPHADSMDPADVPSCWRNLNATVEMEAKELAVARLAEDLHRGPG